MREPFRTAWTVVSGRRIRPRRRAPSERPPLSARAVRCSPVRPDGPRIAPGSGHAASADRRHSYPQGQHTPWTQVPGPATVVIPPRKRGERHARDRHHAGTRGSGRGAGREAGARAAGWVEFELLLGPGEEWEDRSDELFAASSFAAAAAAEGRNILTDALSLPPGPDAGTSPAAFVEADLGKVADALASLAGVLSSRLSSAGRQAHGTADQAACWDAARAARRIHELLARGGS